MQKRDIYRAIMIAAAQGKGVHLSADEVFDLSLDDAIFTRANNTITEEDWDRFNAGGDSFWKNQKPECPPNVGNLAGFHKGDPDRLGWTRT